MVLGIEPELVQPELGEGGNRQEQERIAHQIANPNLQAIEVMGAVIAIGTHRGPEMAHVLHRAGRQLLHHPMDVVVVVPKQGNVGWGQGELQPALGIGAGDRPIEEGGTGAKGQEEGRLTAEQPQPAEQGVHGGHPQVDVDAGRHHPGAIGGFDVVVIRVVGVGTLKPVAIAKAQGAAWQQGEALV